MNHAKSKPRAPFFHLPRPMSLSRDPAPRTSRAAPLPRSNPRQSAVRISSSHPSPHQPKARKSAHKRERNPTETTKKPWKNRKNSGKNGRTCVEHHSKVMKTARKPRRSMGCGSLEVSRQVDSISAPAAGSPATTPTAPFPMALKGVRGRFRPGNASKRRVFIDFGRFRVAFEGRRLPRWPPRTCPPSSSPSRSRAAPAPA